MRLIRYLINLNIIFFRGSLLFKQLCLLVHIWEFTSLLAHCCVIIEKPTVFVLVDGLGVTFTVVVRHVFYEKLGLLSTCWHDLSGFMIHLMEKHLFANDHQLTILVHAIFGKFHVLRLLYLRNQWLFLSFYYLWILKLQFIAHYSIRNIGSRSRCQFCSLKLMGLI